MADLRSWLLNTFDSPEKTGELLQPDLDAGLISYHDFQLAKEGLPPQDTLNRWFAAGAVVSAGLFAYGRFLRVPRAPPQFYGMTAPLPAFVGGSIGLYKEFQAKRRLATELDNPDAFAKAILNVRDRLHGPPGRIQFGRRRTPSEWDDSSKQTQTESEVENVVQSDGVMHVSDSGRSHAENPEDNSNQSRWTEIRRANAQQSGRMTSWDALRRQQHNVEHRRAATSEAKSSSGSSSPTELDKDQERAVEQAKFDAMIEAERKLAADGK